MASFAAPSTPRDTFVAALPVLPAATSASAVSASGKINVDLLKTEIKTNLQEDKTYKAVDAMKKKAIHKAGSYEEFKNFVACAEQKPIGAGEMDSLKQQKGSWTQQQTRAELDKKRSKNLSKKEKSRALPKEFPSIPPTTSMEFERDWRRHCCSSKLADNGYEEKLRYLTLVTAEGAGGLWGTEIDAGIMGAVIGTMWKGGKSTGTVEPSVVKDWLEMMTTCGRFSLNVNFLDDKQVVAVKETLDWLEEKGVEGVEGLREKYK